MGPASISQEYKSTPTICHNRTTVVKASVPSTGIAANFEVFDDFINLLLEKKEKVIGAAFLGFPRIPLLAAWYTKNDKSKVCTKVQRTKHGLSTEM